MDKFYHSPALCAISGMMHTLRAATDLSVQTVSAVIGGEKVTLEPTTEREGLRFWQGSVSPAPDATVLTYTFYADLAPMGSYTVPLAEAKLPVIAITELYLRDKNNCTLYVEIVNTTEARLDLGGYQLMWKRGRVEDEGPTYALPLAPSLGQTILPPRSVAVLWLAFPESHHADPPCLTAEDFCARLEADHAWRGLALSPDAVQIVRIEASEQGEDGIWHARADFAPFKKLRPWDCVTFGISLLGGSLKRPICAVTANDLSCGEWHFDTKPRRASTWQPTAFGGTVPQKVDAATDATPGSLGRGQIIPDIKRDTPLCIAPLALPEVHPLGDGALTLRWLIEGGAVRASRLCVDTSGDDPLYVDACAADGIWSAILPADLLVRLERLPLTIEADNGTYTTRLALPPIKLIDNAGPTVTAFSPENGYAAFRGSAVEVAAAYFDRSGVDAHASHLYFDGMEISHKATWTAEGVRCRLEALKPGKHKLALKLYDCLGNASRTVSYFSVTDPDALYCYRGEVHSHTQDSDGVGSPEQAMTYARDIGRADYFAVTDHNHYIEDAAYAAQRESADRFNEAGRFAVLYGWEMTWNNESGYWGHMNILGSKDIHHDIRDMDLPGLYAYLAERPDAIGMFNHPCLQWGNFDEYAYRTPESDAAVCLDEIKGPRFDAEHALALSHGWHVAPVSNEDNHAFNWTTATPQTGYVLAPALTRQNIMEAMRARRTYTTSDPTLQLRFRINGAWLGSRIPATDTLTVDMRLDTKRPEGIGVVRLIAEDNITVAEWDIGAMRQFEQRIYIPADFDYYYLNVINPLVPDDYTISAPIWIEGRDALAVTEMELALTGGEMPNLVSAVMENSGGAAITDLRADFYLTSEEGFSLMAAKPYHTAYLGKLAAGEHARVARTFPHIMGCRRVSVIVSGRMGKRRFADTRYLLLTPATIAEVLPDSSAVILPDGRTVENPYAYAVLFNHTNAPLSLDGMVLRLWTTTGKNPLPEHIHTLDGITIAARSTAVLWTRGKGSPLTAADFNAHYGTSLIEGEDLFILAGTPLSNSHIAARRLDLAVGDEVISRVHWNYAAAYGKQPTADRALRYGYRGAMTVTSTLLDDAAEPSPGHLEAAQMPSARIYALPPKELRRGKKADKRALKQARKPEKKGVKAGTAAAMSLGAAATGIAVGVGSALLAALVHRKRGQT